MEKQCKNCGAIKSIDEFYNHRNTKDGKLNKCKTCCQQYDRIHKAKPEIRQKTRERNKKNHKKLKAWRQEHYSKPEVKERRAQQRREYRKLPEVKARRRAEKKMAALINGKYSTSKLLGCTGKELKAYLESLWQEGMTWENYGLYGWHIDHIKPISSFDLSDPKQQAECFHYTNLQPLWAKDNLQKGNKTN